MRSLVATALTLANHEGIRLTLLYIHDGRDNAITRREHVRHQAGHYGIGRVTEIDLPHAYGHGHGRGPGGEPMGTLVPPRLLLAALAEARWQQAEQLIWPLSVNAETRAMAKASEQLQLCRYLAETEGTPMPELTAPLLEMSDQQVVELGAQLQVPWQLAWSCFEQAEHPCRTCTACRRRKAAFEAAGIVDSADSVVTSRS